jgi:hypothetical protein
MSAAHTYTDGVESGRTVTRRTLAIAAIAAVTLLVVGFVGYSAGESNRGSRLTVLTGNAYVGDHEASMKVDGWAYGVTGSVAWMDAGGSFHESGWPACLAPIGSTGRVRFGEVPVAGPDSGGIGLRAVVWIDCRGAIQVR